MSEKVEFQTMKEALQNLDSEMTEICDKLKLYNHHICELVQQVVDNAGKDRSTD